MKKLIVSIMFVAILISMASCSQRPDVSTPESAAPEVTETPQADATVTEAIETPQLDAPGIEVIKSAFIDEVMSYHPGTAGASMKKAIAAYKVLEFSVTNQLESLESGILDNSLSDAWSTLSDDEKGTFAENFASVADLIQSCFDDIQSNQGLLDDSGVYNEMSELIGRDNSLSAWSALKNSVEKLITKD